MSGNDKQKLPQRRSSCNTEMTAVAKRLRRRCTLAEKRLWEIVRDRKCGQRFYRQVPASQYVLDFYCPYARLAIELDGGIHDLPEVQERDRDRETAVTEELKLTVLRLTNDEVMTALTRHCRKR